jgi:Eukaryotic protein of unknown function (DUF846)
MMGASVEMATEGDAPGSKFLSDALPAVSTADVEAGGSDYDRAGRGNASSGSGVVQGILRQSSHKTTATFHVGLKLAAVASYLALGLLTSSFVIQFVATVTLLAVDFWMVKNVAGRLLVGLRWWNEVGDDGTTQTWRFESIPDRTQLNVIDGRIFWWTLYATPVAWVLLGVVCILKFNLSYLVIVVIAITLAGANIVGYYKCDKDATEQMRNYIGKSMLGAAMEQSGLSSLSRFLPG